MSNNQNQNKNLPNLGKAYEELNRVPQPPPEGNLLGLNQPIPAPVAQPLPEPSANLINLFRGTGPFTAGIFLDNDEEHRHTVRNTCLDKIKIVNVPETPSYMFQGASIASLPYTRFLQKLSPKGTDTAKLLSRLCLRQSGGIENYDKVSGINTENVEEVMEWVEAQPEGSRLAAIFDFDRTISVMEGGFFVGSSIYGFKKYIYEAFPKGDQILNFVPLVTAEGFAEYLAGGSQRMAMIQEMFDFLYEHNVTIFLLTNNGACIKSKGLFQELMMVYTRGRVVEIICGIEFERNKGRAILGKNSNTGDLKALREMCVRRGGKKTRRHKKRKQTKRR